MAENAEQVKGFEKDKFETAASHVLADIDYGFFIFATCEDKPAGFMYFTYEWSDWRNGLFFWLQSVHVRD